MTLCEWLSFPRNSPVALHRSLFVSQHANHLKWQLVFFFFLLALVGSRVRYSVSTLGLQQKHNGSATAPQFSSPKDYYAQARNFSFGSLAQSWAYSPLCVYRIVDPKQTEAQSVTTNPNADQRNCGNGTRSTPDIMWTPSPFLIMLRGKCGCP